MFDNYGALFLGERSAEVLCDYGAGPNHVLPTGGCAKFTGGLSVFTFLRTRTWLSVNNSSQAADLAKDAAALAELEGLSGHAKAAKLRANLSDED
jgi:phosphoribosyl-ATP pyrophosphohydrolase/phosphoribosyl-AMP cyclohydrolase/histidinol dehydrogenase